MTDRFNRRAAAVLLAALALNGACGSGSEEEATTSSTATSAASSTVPAGDSVTTTAPAPPTTTTTAPQGRRIEIGFSKGSVVGGIRTESVKVGEKVTLVATSDVAEELHLHTYDLTTDLSPGVPGEITFEATIPGRHEVEFEKSGKAALTLEVK